MLVLSNWQVNAKTITYYNNLLPQNDKLWSRYCIKQVSDQVKGKQMVGEIFEYIWFKGAQKVCLEISDAAEEEVSGMIYGLESQPTAE